MNRKALLVIVVLVVAIVGALTYVLMSGGGKKTENPTPDQQVNKDMQDPSSRSPSVEAKGKYGEYTSTALAEAEGTTILLFFYAPWCPQCREVEKTINEGGVPNNVTVLKVDYDSNQSLRQKYGVTLQTTFVKVDKDGNKFASYVAYNEPSFGAVKRALLP